MHPSYLIAADKLRQQADSVLHTLNFHAVVENVGKLYFTGSYALNLMTWNDIDMQIVIPDTLSPPAALMDILNAFAHQKNFVKAQLIHFSEEYKPHWPRGHCLCIKLNMPNLGGIWKFDLWVLEQRAFQQNQALLQQLKQKLTDPLRKLILQIKNDLMLHTGRVPKMGSHWLYQAVLIHGIIEKQAILDFLREKGVTFD